MTFQPNCEIGFCDHRDDTFHRKPSDEKAILSQLSQLLRGAMQCLLFQYEKKKSLLINFINVKTRDSMPLFWLLGATLFMYNIALCPLFLFCFCNC